jgi:hypothetical protein
MTTTLRTLATVGALLALVHISDAAAQRRRGLVDVTPANDRHGAWLSFGLGAGTDSYKYDDNGGYRHDLTKPAFYLAAGGTVNPHLRLGGEINAWVNAYNDQNGYGITESLVGGLLTAQVYPAANLGLYLKGGLGISRSGADVSGGSGLSETGFAYQYGAGYELKLGRNFFLSPAVTLLYHQSSPGNRNDPSNLGTLHERVITVGVGLTFQPGR